MHTEIGQDLGSCAKNTQKPPKATARIQSQQPDPSPDLNTSSPSSTGHTAAHSSLPVHLSQWRRNILEYVLTCHANDALVLDGATGEPGIRGATRQLGIIVLRCYLQCQDTRCDIPVLRKVNGRQKDGVLAKGYVGKNVILNISS